jgi:4'-phosphopantetheinyl transferase
MTTGASGEPVVTIWHARTGEAFPSDDRRRRARAWLTPADQARHDRYRQQADRDMFLLGRAMARALVGQVLGVEPCAWRWREGPRGRPEADADVSFNIGHSAGMVVCAVSRHGRVGVDVEDRRRAPVDARMVRRYCAPAEAGDIELGGPEGWPDQFLKYWTLKEAYLKARGLGITVHLADLCFTIAPDAIRLDRLNGFEDDADWDFVLDASSGSHFVAAAATVLSGRRPSFTITPFPAALLP